MFLSNKFLNYETGEIEIDEDVLKNACESYFVIYEDDFEDSFPENGYVGIRTNSENKQSAWNMLKLLLEKEIQMEIATTTAETPVLKTIVGEVINDCMEETCWNADAVVTAENLEDSFVTDYYEYITSPGGRDFMNDFLLGDFYSYMELFYKGVATFEECYEEFHVDAKIYLTE